MRSIRRKYSKLSCRHGSCMVHIANPSLEISTDRHGPGQTGRSVQYMVYPCLVDLFNVLGYLQNVLVALPGIEYST
jgi:hypothetical protein